MPERIRLDYTHMAHALTPALWESAALRISDAHALLASRRGPGKEFLGWIDLPETMVPLLERLAETAGDIAASSDLLIVIGIGGSYLGARAVIEALVPPFAKGPVEILFAGHHIDGEYLEQLLRHAEGRRVSVNVISKSGTTTEPAIAFRVIKSWMDRMYGRAESRRRIVATTDAARGALRALAAEEGYRTFTIPEDVGGRFSVLTPVGLLPVAAAGIPIGEILDGAGAMRTRVAEISFTGNPAFVYALLRLAMAESGKSIEVLASFVPQLNGIAEWWKQLFGESEGKMGRGVFPASVGYTTDLHSLGQYLQEGRRNLFETFLFAEAPRAETPLPPAPGDDGLHYLDGRPLSRINREAYRSTAFAHLEGGVPNMTLLLPAVTPRAIGELIYMFETAVALGGYAIGVNPFDQPGVEAYKQNMFALLGKPGFEAVRAALEERMRGHAEHLVE